MTAPWSTQPITGAQHDAWMAEERQRAEYPRWVSYGGEPMLTEKEHEDFHAVTKQLFPDVFIRKEYVR